MYPNPNWFWWFVSLGFLINRKTPSPKTLAVAVNTCWWLSLKSLTQADQYFSWMPSCSNFHIADARVPLLAPRLLKAPPELGSYHLKIIIPSMHPRIEPCYSTLQRREMPSVNPRHFMPGESPRQLQLPVPKHDSWPCTAGLPLQHSL